MMECILENSSSLPGVSFKNLPNGSELLLDCENGSGRMVFHTLFPGLTFSFIQADAYVWPESDANLQLKPLQINYCVSGRCELLLDDGTYFYLKENDFCISRQTAQKEYIFPTGHYQGIKIYFDPKLLSQSGSPVLNAFSIIPAQLETLYFQKRKTYLNETCDTLQSVFQKLWQLPGQPQPSDFYLQIYTLELLHQLLNMEQQPSKVCGFYTNTQVKLAKRTARILSADLRQHIPVRQIAADLSVSESSLKNYFRGVYGQNISSWLRKVRMDAAAELLSDTNASVADISGQVEYSNQGKFAAVFKKQFGISPLEYRRLKRLE